MICSIPMSSEKKNRTDMGQRSEVRKSEEKRKAEIEVKETERGSEVMKDITVLVSACGAQFMPGLADCLKQNGERNVRIVGVDMGIDRTVLQMVDALYQVPRATDPE